MPGYWGETKVIQISKWFKFQCHPGFCLKNKKLNIKYHKMFTRPLHSWYPSTQAMWLPQDWPRNQHRLGGDYGVQGWNLEGTESTGWILANCQDPAWPFPQATKECSLTKKKRVNQSAAFSSCSHSCGKNRQLGSQLQTLKTWCYVWRMLHWLLHCTLDLLKERSSASRPHLSYPCKQAHLEDPEISRNMPLWLNMWEDWVMRKCFR
jgi:hypothetical protein